MHNRSDASTRLPAGKHFAVTWSVPVVHGGRTNSMLHRSRAFAAEGGAPVQVLTFDNFRDYQDIRKTLTEQGKLSDGVTIRNIWEDLTDLAGNAPVLPAADLTGFSPLGETGIPVTTVEGGPSGRTQRFAADGTTLLQTDYLREDGTLFLSDRSDVESPGQHGGRSLTLCNAEGLPVEQWRSSWEMYRSWLDHLTDGDDSYFIVDNKHAATFMKTYRRPTATVFLMVHDSHLATAIHGPASQLSGSGEVVIPRFDNFDGVAILTQMQAADIRARIADIGNIHVIPNSRSAPVEPVEAERNPAAGVLLAQLRPLKQIDHAIRAVTDVNHRLQTNATLAIYGEGDEASKLEGLIDHLGVSSLVQLKGHTHSPDRVFGEASFSLLTSSSESFGLVILESMSAGCVPIAYDIHYGPSSIITHGVNGYIVEYGNELALAESVAEFLALPEEQKAEMRKAAICRAADFSDAPVVSMWSEALAAAAARKAIPAPELHVTVTGTAWGTWSDGALDLRVTALLTAESDSLDADTPHFLCRLRTRGGETFFRASGEMTSKTDGGVFTSVFRFTPDIMQALSGSIVDATLETQLLGRRVTSRLPYSAPAATPMDVYTTVHGNLSLRPAKPVTPAPAPVPATAVTPAPAPVPATAVTPAPAPVPAKAEIPPTAPSQPKPLESPMKTPDVRELTARSAKNFPAGYHCAITWGIPTEYGGMTNALLHRSRSFIREAGVPVDVLTFAWSDKYADIRRDLEAAGELVAGLRLRNLWEELPELSPTQLAAPKPGNVVEGGFSPIGAEEKSSEEVSGGVLRRRLRYASDQKTVLQVDYFRPDGSLVVADRRDVTVRGVEGGRLVSLCGWDGRPVASWNQIWPLYLFWLDCVVENRESFMIVDSKSTANFMTRYRRDNVATMHLVHNSHMASGAIPPYGELSPTRRYVFERLSSFDAVVLLTERQKKDVDLVFNNPRNTCVIPNSRSLPEVSNPELGHDPRLGVILGSLTNRKRLDHAISAVDLARQPGNAEFNLRIYGQGPEEASLRKLIAARDLDKYVELAGYSSSARQEFAGASFTLLTSTLEGQGLVLIEAMSVGCIPIAYDVPYGPSDIIEHGVNGFLVEAGDIPALAERIRQVGLMDEAALQDMRRAAFARAHEFNDEIVVQKWGTAMRQAVDRKLSAAVYTPSSKGSI